MPKHVISRNWSRFYDIKTEVQFEPVVDVNSGCFIGHAELDEATAEVFAARPGFEVVSDDLYALLISGTVPVPAPIVPSSTGDPLLDSAERSRVDAAPTAQPGASAGDVLNGPPNAESSARPEPPKGK